MNDFDNNLIHSLETFLIGCQSLGARRWVRDRYEELDSVPDNSLRTKVFVQALSRLSPTFAAEVIEHLRLAMQRREVEYESLYSTLLNLQTLIEAFPTQQRLHKIIDTLRQRGYKASWWLLTSGPPKLAFSPQRDQAPGLTLGERISLAKKPSPGQIEKLLFDPNEAVIRTLLNNPRITEVEVLKLAASPPTTPNILQTIAQHPRWMTNYKVKLALIHHTNTPVGVACGLLNYLVLKDLDEVCQGSHLARDLRETAENLLRERILSMSAEERSALALGASPSLIGLLLENPTPLVLLGLLENPQLTSAEVLTMALDPRTPPQILERIGQNFQWSGNRSVALAMIKHPQCPTPLKHRLYRFLMDVIGSRKEKENN